MYVSILWLLANRSVNVLVLRRITSYRIMLYPYWFWITGLLWSGSYVTGQCVHQYWNERINITWSAKYWIINLIDLTLDSGQQVLCILATKWIKCNLVGKNANESLTFHKLLWIATTENVHWPVQDTAWQILTEEQLTEHRDRSQGDVQE